MPALLFGLAPGRACPFHPARRPGPRADSSLLRWSSPRGGRVLPATLRRGARTFLAPCGRPPGPRPSDRLTGNSILRVPTELRVGPSGLGTGGPRAPTVPGRLGGPLGARSFVHRGRRWSSSASAGRSVHDPLCDHGRQRPRAAPADPALAHADPAPAHAPLGTAHAPLGTALERSPGTWQETLTWLDP